MICYGHAVERRSECPIVWALDVFGDKWSLLLIRDIGTYGRTRYAEFEDAGESIATNILADRLKSLTAANIIEKRSDPDDGRRYLYSLTDKGRDLLPIVLEIILWSAKHDPDSAVPTSFVAKANIDRNAILKSWGYKPD